MKLSTLLYQNEYTSGFSAEEIEITRIVSDIRGISPGCLFVCLRTGRHDFLTVLTKAEEGGAAALVAERGALVPTETSLPVFFVPSTRRTLAYLHSRYHSSPEKELVMIGVTGTNGKTSTATILYSILRASGIRAGLIGTAECVYDGNVYTLPDEEGGARLRTMTTPDPDILYPILKTMKDAGITHVVMEVSSHALTLMKVAPIFFRIGIFTNLSPEHMDFHGSMEAYSEAKARLFLQCKTGILNCDDPHAEEMIEKSTCDIRRCGVVSQGSIRATDIELYGTAGCVYSYIAPGIRLRIRTPLFGSFSVYNTLLALTAAIELGVSPLVASDALSQGIRVPGRMERVPLGGGADFSVFIDYAHTEAALRSLLSSVRAFRRPGERIVLLFGCGGDRDRTKRAPMGRVAEELADLVFLTSDNCRGEDPKAIIKEVLSGTHHPERVRVIVNRRRAIEEAIRTAKSGDIVILAGKGHETYEITAAGIKHFDERKITLLALEKRKNGDTEDED